jgi:hypothetical protein
MSRKRRTRVALCEMLRRGVHTTLHHIEATMVNTECLALWYRTLTETYPAEAVVILTADLCVCAANTTARLRYNLPLDELVPVSPFAVFGPASRRICEEECRRAVAGESPAHLCAHHQDGRMACVRLFPIWRSQEVAGLGVVARDVEIWPDGTCVEAIGCRRPARRQVELPGIVAMRLID